MKGEILSSLASKKANAIKPAARAAISGSIIPLFKKSLFIVFSAYGLTPFRKYYLFISLRAFVGLNAFFFFGLYAGGFLSFFVYLLFFAVILLTS